MEELDLILSQPQATQDEILSVFDVMMDAVALEPRVTPPGGVPPIVQRRPQDFNVLASNFVVFSLTILTPNSGLPWRDQQKLVRLRGRSVAQSSQILASMLRPEQKLLILAKAQLPPGDFVPTDSVIYVAVSSKFQMKKTLGKQIYGLRWDKPQPEEGNLRRLDEDDEEMVDAEEDRTSTSDSRSLALSSSSSSARQGESVVDKKEESKPEVEYAGLTQYGVARYDQHMDGTKAGAKKGHYKMANAVLHTHVLSAVTLGEFFLFFSPSFFPERISTRFKR